MLLGRNFVTIGPSFAFAPAGVPRLRKAFAEQERTAGRLQNTIRKHKSELSVIPTPHFTLPIYTVTI